MTLGKAVKDLFSIELRNDGKMTGFQSLESIYNIAVNHVKGASGQQKTILENINDVSKYRITSVELYCLLAIILIEVAKDKTQWVHLLNKKLPNEITYDPNFIESCCQFFVSRIKIIPITEKNWKYAITLLRISTLTDEITKVFSVSKNIIQSLNINVINHVITDFQLLNTVFTLMVVFEVEDSIVSDIIRSRIQKRSYLLGNATIINLVMTNYHSHLINFYRVEKCCMLYKKDHLISKKLLSIPTGSGRQFCYIQVIYSNLFIWAGSSLLIQIQLKDILFKKHSNSTVTLNFVEGDSLPLVIAFSGFGSKGFPLNYLVGIELRMEDMKDCNSFFNKMNNNFRISEASNYLLLNHSDTDVISEGGHAGAIINKIQESQKNVIQNEVHDDSSKRVKDQCQQNLQLQTPERSDLKKSADEWDLKDDCSNDRYVNGTMINEMESSPLEGVCKRTVQRQLSKCADILKKDLTKEFETDLIGSIEVMRENHLDPSSSLVITKYDNIQTTKKFVNGGQLTSQFLGTRKKKTENILKPTRKNGKKIQKKDNLQILNTIFGAPKFKINNTRHTNKKQKKVPGKLTTVIEQVKNTSLKRVDRGEINAVVSENDRNVRDMITPSEQIKNSDISTERIGSIMKGNPKGVADNLDEKESLPAVKKEPMNAFALSIQEQLAQSLNQIANQMVTRISLINEELNAKIMKDLSEKYRNIFQELQLSFQNDVDNMTSFLSEIEGLTSLSETELSNLIRERHVIETRLYLSPRRDS
ncbi:hypothetical protein RNJ44_03896 [Nakaseomyces bracarensis]|uniref:Uncharacterized protein n=1 Tax=Nakaseomyces bracarensis TaxID=273131 RepID=A0ABR4NY83_9SACH